MDIVIKSEKVVSSVTLTLTQREAELLREVTEFSLAVSSQVSEEYKAEVSVFLAALRTGLSREGVRMI